MAAIANSRHPRRNLGRTAQQLAIQSVIILLGTVMVYPLLWLVASSFKDSSEIFTRAGTLIPQTFTWENYRSGWAGFGGITFATFFRNSLTISVASTVGAVASSAVVAYGFARLPFWGRRFWFACMMLTLMLPMQVQIIPQYIVFSELDWINTFLPLVAPKFFGNAFFIFLMMQFIRGLPRELDEAAEIDGCSPIGIFWRITLPLIAPALITSGIFSFYWTWEDFFGPLLYLNDPKLFTVSLALRNFADPSAATNWGAIFAMSTLSLLPAFVLFLLFQRYLVQGISTTGLKG
ncbi:MAG TPA: carbohydrate ABC transporter permease [Roseiflexaceae bacterium]|nr:carbohydrate ABC transporter permease [Roseiflexaceae bacterium]